MGKPCGQHTSTCSYLGNVAVDKKDRKCQGVKICEFANPELLEMSHESVNTDSDLQLKINKEASDDNIENTTFAIYLQHSKPNVGICRMECNVLESQY